MLRWLTLLVAAAGALVTVPNASSALDADHPLAAAFRRYLDESFRLRPLDATRLGEHRFDDRLDDVSPAARAAWVALDRKTLSELRSQIDVARLSADGKVDYGIFTHELTKSLWLAQHLRRFERDPRTYGEYISDSVFVLLMQSTLPREKNIANCIARMKQIPRVTAAARESLTNPPRVVTETAIRQNRGAIGFYEKGLFELAAGSPQLPALKAAAAPVIACLKDHQRFLEEDLLPRAKGEWRLGAELFGEKLDMDLDAGLPAAQVLADAEAEFDRVTRDMYVIARQLWGRYYPKLALPPDDAAGRHATIAQVLHAVSQEHGRPEDLVADARATVAQVKQFIRTRDILRLPEPDRCQVIEMPEFQRGNAVAYMNAAPPLDATAASIFAVSPPPADWDAARVRSFLEEYNRHMLQILTIHEAYPGHYVQLEYANRNPSLVRKVLGSGVYAEGWAVYTEQMMLDQGYGDGDLALRLVQLKFYLRAVTNAILDHRMHCTQMSDDEALKLLVDRAFQSDGEARLKIIRAKQSSCQLSTYFVGRMAFYRLRQKIERELGARFDLGRYHEAVLAPGSVPVKHLPELARARLLNPR